MKVARRLGMAALWVVLVVVSLAFLLPFLWMIVTALKAPDEVFTRLLPSSPRWQNFGDAFSQPGLPLGRFFLNSVFLTGTCTALGLLSSSVAAYAFARLRFPGRDGIFLAVLATMMVPAAVTMIPGFVVFQRLGWIDTYWPFIVPAMGGSAFQIFFLRETFKTLPNDLFDSGRLDGCGNLQMCFRIAMPLAKPTLTTLAIFSILGYWNDFMGPLIYLHSVENRTLALGLYSFSSLNNTQWSLLMAASVIAIAPVLLLFFRFQAAFEKGLVMSGVKG